MAITTPDAVPGEVIEAAWGDAVRADLISVEAGVNARVRKAGDIMTGELQIGGAANTDVAGLREFPSGLLWSTATVGGGSTLSDANVWLNRTGASAGQPAAVGGVYQRFTRGWATTIGSIAIGTGGTQVAYNTTSDKRLKSLVGPVDGDEAVAKVGALEPVAYTWNDAPEAGEQVGFFAQDVYDVAPEAVTPGEGEPGDEAFTPWMMDVSRLVPTLVAAVQALTRRIEELEGVAA